MTETFEVKYPTFQTSIADRIRLICPGDPVAPPATCIICGGIMVNGKTLIDFGFFIEHYGRLQICNLCFGNAASTFDYVSPEQQQTFLKEHKKVAKRAEELLKENERLREYEHIIHTIHNSGLFSNTKFASMVSDREANANHDNTERKLSNNNSNAENTTDSGRGEISATTKQDAEQGSPGIRYIANLDIDGLADLGDL